MNAKVQKNTMQKLALLLLTTLSAFAGGPRPASADHDVDVQATSNKIADRLNSITLQNWEKELICQNSQTNIYLLFSNNSARVKNSN